MYAPTLRPTKALGLMFALFPTVSRETFFQKNIFKLVKIAEFPVKIPKYNLCQRLNVSQKQAKETRIPNIL
jgi:hypothetical protein